MIYVLGINCTPPAIEDFPHDLFDEEQRQGGAVVVHVIVSLYLFIALAVVCDKFFVPAVEKICHGKGSAYIILIFFSAQLLLNFTSLARLHARIAGCAYERGSSRSREPSP